MPATFYGPVRAKPIQLADGSILAGTSMEAGGGRDLRVWDPFVDRSADDGLSWARSNSFNVPGRHAQIQPALFQAKDGRVIALLRSFNPLNVCKAESRDGGRLFTPARPINALPNPSAGIDVVKTKEGDVYLIYNHTPAGRTPLSLARSTDDGDTWYKVADLEAEPGEYSDPAMIQSADGKLQITYTWKRTHIKHVTVDPAKYRG
jgi:predicted neuraminidase